MGWATATPFNEAVSGRVTSLAESVSAQGNPWLVMGTAGGGVWMSSTPNAAAGNAIWEPVADSPTMPAGVTAAQTAQLRGGISAIGAVAVDPTTPQNIYAGTGEANWSADSRYGAGIMVSRDNGNSWTLVSGTAASPIASFGHSVAKIFVDPTATI